MKAISDLLPPCVVIEHNDSGKGTIFSCSAARPWPFTSGTENYSMSFVVSLALALLQGYITRKTGLWYYGE
jgi:hypothetical protein